MFQQDNDDDKFLLYQAVDSKNKNAKVLDKTILGLHNITGIDLHLAQQTETPTNDLYRKSGLGFLKEILLKYLDLVNNREYVEWFFFENSTLASTVESSNLAAYVGVHGNVDQQKAESIFKSYSGTIQNLQANNAVVFWHPDLYKYPKKPRYFISELSGDHYAGAKVNNSCEFFKLTKDGKDERVKLENEMDKLSPAIKAKKIEVRAQDKKIKVEKVTDETSEEESKKTWAVNSSFEMRFFEVMSREKSVLVIGNSEFPEALHLLNHGYYNENFPGVEDRRTIFLSIPLLGPRTEAFKNSFKDYGADEEGENAYKDNYYGIGCLFFYIVPVNDEAAKKLLKEVHWDLFAREVSLMIKDLSVSYLLATGLNLAARARNEAIKSAKAAIMARNMSHNIGSHVISYLNGHLSNVDAVLEAGVLKNIIRRETKDGKITLHFSDVVKKTGEFNKDKIQLPFLLGLGKFLGYLQERQDFIASIATDHIPPSSGINFKDFVLDGFAWDSRQKRHSEDDLKEYHNILLEYIAKSEGITRSKLRIVFNGKNIDERFSEDSDVRSINIALPGGIMGRQALFSIFENIIRNSAKHAKSKNDFELNIFVGDIVNLNPESNNLEVNEGLGRFQFFDLKLREGEPVEIFNTSSANDPGNNWIKKLREEKDMNYSMLIRDDFGNATSENLKNVIEGLGKGMVNEDDYTLNEQAKGLKEIRISAAWLRGKSVIEEKNSEKSFPIVLPYRYTDPDNRQHLGFHFLLSKSFEVILITDKLEIDENSKKDLLAKHWFVLPSKDIEKLNRLNAKIFLLDQDLEGVFKSFIYPEGFSREFTPGAFSKRMFIITLNGNFDVSLIKDDKSLVSVGNLKQTEINSVFISCYDVLLQRNYDANTANVIIKIEDEEHQNDSYKPTEDVSGNIVYITPGSNRKFSRYSKQIYFKKHFNLNHEIDDSYFIESITGDNSTNRLLRSELKDRAWFFKMAESSLTKILVIDERIWDDIVMPNKRLFIDYDSYKDSGKFKSDAGELFLNDLGGNLSSEEMIELQSLFEKLSKDPKNDFSALNTQLKIKNQISDKPEARVLLYRLKQIYFANIFISGTETSNTTKQNAKANFWEIDFSEREPKAISKTLIESSREGINFIGTATREYDFVLIHQGLLDKIKTHLYDKYSDNLAKLKSYFGKATIIVHSGRSRPAEDQLPNWVPFISFSSVRSLLDDAKYALTEQLLAAHPIVAKK